MKQFANDLGGLARFDLGRKVVDQTGLNGYYTVALHWAPVDTANPIRCRTECARAERSIGLHRRQGTTWVGSQTSQRPTRHHRD
jgi:uncharacterized protein (TIGR03435 family)